MGILSTRKKRENYSTNFLLSLKFKGNCSLHLQHIIFGFPFKISETKRPLHSRSSIWKVRQYNTNLQHIVYLPFHFSYQMQIWWKYYLIFTYMLYSESPGNWAASSNLLKFESINKLKGKLNILSKLYFLFKIKSCMLQAKYKIICS